jgi:hypothetical protein
MNLGLRKTLEKTSEYIFLILLAYIPLHVLFSTWIGTSTGLLDVAKISKEVLLVCGFIMVLCTASLTSLKRFSRDKLVWLIAAYATLTVLIALIKPTDQDAELIAVVYNLRFLLFFLYAGLLMSRLDSNFIIKSVKIVLLSGTIVALFGIFQVTLLPNDALSHIGYSKENGTPAVFYISDETQAIERAYSTIKDPNSLGSYLIIIISLSVLYLIQKWPKQRLLLGGIVLASTLCLLLTYSRSAWIGVIAALGVLVLLIPRTRNLVIINKNKLLFLGLGIAALLIAGLVVFRDTSFVQNTVFHVGDDAVATSNSQRVDSFSNTLERIVENPSGYGPGTAGPASFKNDSLEIIPENYYLQIAYEVGVVGLGLFLVICAVVVKRLFGFKKESNVAIALLAAFVGIAVANLFVHIWFNEAVAYTWWGIAGLSLYASRIKAVSTKANKTKKQQ